MPCKFPSEEFATGYSDTQEGARVRDTAAYMARRDLFTSGLEMERSELVSRREAMRKSAERIALNKRVSAGTNVGLKTTALRTTNMTSLT